MPPADPAADEPGADIPDVAPLLEDYSVEDTVICTLCSHSSMQIFHGARQAGFETLGIAVGERPRHYDAFPQARPDEFLLVKDHDEILDRAGELVDRHAIVVPHGSFVEYLGADKFKTLEAPTFGNRRVLEWESDRLRSREWLTEAGIRMPDQIDDPQDIRGPTLVKYMGAKGGRGFFIATNPQEFEENIDESQDYVIQKYILGTRYYFHYFYSPLRTDGYEVADGRLEMLGCDRRDETNIDEIHRLGSLGNITRLRKMGINPSFVVAGNLPLVLRESLLPQVLEMGELAVTSSQERFGGLVGPFCLETVITDDLEFVVFEISCRIVAGTNLYPTGSQYTAFMDEHVSTGRRIADEVKHALETDRLAEVVS